MVQVDMARKPVPFVMRGEPETTRRRSTLQDEPDKRLANPRVPRLTAERLAQVTRHNSLPVRYQASNRLLERWAVGQGSGLPLHADDADRLPPSRPTPLPLDKSVVADLTILHSPDWAKRFVFMWYRSDKSPEQIAEDIGVSRSEVYRRHREVLAYYLGRFTELGFDVQPWEPDT